MNSTKRKHWAIWFFQSCAHDSICHGTPEPPYGLDTAFEPLLFIPDVRTAWLDVPGTYCPSEMIIDTENPAASLLITTLNRTAECGVAMPVGPRLHQSEIDCIAEWVYQVAEQGRSQR